MGYIGFVESCPYYNSPEGKKIQIANNKYKHRNKVKIYNLTKLAEEISGSMAYIQNQRSLRKPRSHKQRAANKECTGTKSGAKQIGLSQITKAYSA